MRFRLAYSAYCYFCGRFTDHTNVGCSECGR